MQQLATLKRTQSSSSKSLYSALSAAESREQNGVAPAMGGAMWVAMSSWFTPTVLFCLLNLMIATIFITSSLKKQDQPPKPNRVCLDDPVQLFRSPSLFERVKSISFSRHRAEQPVPFHLETQYVEPIEERIEKVTLDEDNEETEGHVARSMSETLLETPAKLPVKMMKKSGSAKMAPEKEVERRRPATARDGNGRRSGTVSFGEDEAVDEKADDFINRFKQQLKLQRIESILRCKPK